MAAACPFCAAKCSADMSSAAPAFTAALPSHKSLMTSACPAHAARCSLNEIGRRENTFGRVKTASKKVYLDFKRTNYAKRIE